MITGAMASLRARDRRALVVGAAALALLLAWARIVQPGLARLASDRRALAEQQALLERERALVALAPTLPALGAEARRSLAAEQPRLIAGDSVSASAALTSYVAQVATAAGVHLTAIEARAPDGSQGVMQLSADVRGEGRWRELLGFVRLLEVSGQLVDVSTIRLERGPRGGPLGGDLVSLSATIIAYGGGAR